MKISNHHSSFRRVFSRSRFCLAGPWGWVGLIFLLTSCADLAGPQYQRPETVSKTAWKSSSAANVSAADTIDPDWWKYFGDSTLNHLIAQAIEQSVDLKVLAARLGVAETAVGQVKAASLPSMQVGAGASFDRSSGGPTTSLNNVATSVNWELDIWGKVKKGVDAQRAEVLATAADWRAGYLNLVAEVSTTYFQLLKLDEQMDTQRHTLESAQRVLDIVTGLNREGIVPQTQVLQQKAEIHQLNRDLLELKRLRGITENALATLLGTAAGEMQLPPGKLTQNIDIIKVPGGLPSDLLARRPDILAAEYRVLQAHHLEGQAKLAKLPSFSLTGRLGSSSSNLLDLLKSFTAGLLPTVNIPILDPSINA
ncbi:MAG TPA: efflux transporter outer membrane subunit, partial [Gammaproteobacteria bacterium]|nr:efflux transporter outer membrane subunit [Gammaproteobacteria bacterium]